MSFRCLAIALVFLLTDLSAAQDVLDRETAKALFLPHTQVPGEYLGQFGEFRSPLVFADGGKVASAADWQRRRKEIVMQWHELMGPWPNVLTKPQSTVAETQIREGIKVDKLNLEIAINQTQTAWLLTPPGEGPWPAVLVVYYDPETSIGMKPEKPLRDFAWQLARRGFVTLSIGTPGGNAWKPELKNAVCQPLSYHAYVAANCWNALAAMPNVDSTRIGVVGHSYGGKWAMFAAALWEKFSCVAVSDPGIVFDETRSNVNYWEPWYLGFDPEVTRKPGIPSEGNPRTGAYRKMMESKLDLHEVHALLAPRPFLVSGGAEDPPQRWLALNHLREVNRLLGYQERVAMTNRPKHDPTEASNAVIYAFFQVASDLK